MLSTSKCRLANPTSTGSVMVSLYHPYQILVGQEMICQLDMGESRSGVRGNGTNKPHISGATILNKPRMEGNAVSCVLRVCDLSDSN